MSEKLNIANEMRCVDQKDRAFYDSLTDEERKKKAKRKERHAVWFGCRLRQQSNPIELGRIWELFSTQIPTALALFGSRVLLRSPGRE